MKIGDKIFRFNANRRFYRRDANGKAYGGPIYREHWAQVDITGETSRSWIIDYGYGKAKIPKKGEHHGYAFTQQEVDDDCYINDHAHNISDRIGRLKDAMTLRRVAEIIGYKPELPK